MPTQSNIIRKVSPDGNTSLELNWYSNGSFVKVEITVTVPGGQELKVTPQDPYSGPDGTERKYENKFQNPTAPPWVLSNHPEATNQEIGPAVRDVIV